MGYKKYLSDKGFTYSEANDDWRKGLGWGKSLKVARIFGTLFEMKRDQVVVYSNFTDTFEEFKKQVNILIDG